MLGANVLFHRWIRRWRWESTFAGTEGSAPNVVERLTIQRAPNNRHPSLTTVENLEARDGQCREE